VLAKHGEYKAAVAKRRAADAQRRTFDDALKSWVLNRFGANSNVAHDFGYTARKVGDPGTQAKADAVKLAKATREARGTIGKKKKLKIKGSLTPLVQGNSPPAAHAASADAVTPPINATNGIANGTAHA
jgi:hypothetical protein